MGWASVDVEEGGDNLIAWLRHQSADIEERIRWALDECAKEWRWIVRNSTWFNDRPSPEADILARVYKEGQAWVLEYGWRNYRGSASAATARLELRKQLGLPIFLAFLAQSIEGKR